MCPDFTSPATAIDAWWQYRTPAEPEGGNRATRSTNWQCTDGAALLRLYRCYGRVALERRGKQSRPLCAWREPLDDVVVHT
jgi:hypothetical protein